DKIKRSEHREGDAAHAMNECFITEKNAGHNQADQVSRQDCFALCGGGETTEKKQNEKDEFYFRLAHACRTQLIDDPLCPHRHEPKDDAHGYDKNEQPEIVICEEPAEREHGSKIRNETRRQNHFPHGGIAESTLNHNGVDHGN